MDKLLRVETINATYHPAKLAFLALHQDYSSDPVEDTGMLEEECAQKVVDRLLLGNRGHYGPLEHPSITFGCYFFPHSVVQQARTHRISVSFDVQSFRYTGDQFIDVANGDKDIEQVVYARPVGEYKGRAGNSYTYTEFSRQADLEYAKVACERYKQLYIRGYSEEHIRGSMPFDYRQHFYVTFNMRSLMHFLDLRSKKDAQIEIQWLCDLLFERFEEWSPEIAGWYEANRLHKARLAP